MTACSSTMTFGTGSIDLDKWLAELLGDEYQEWPVHHCDQEAGHEMPHTEGDDYTWDNGLTITVKLRLSSS